MQINLQKPDHTNIIHGINLTDQGCEIRVADSTYTSSVILTLDTVELWDVTGFEALGAEHFRKLSELGVEVVVLGTGRELQFPDPGLTRSLVTNQIGLEVMDTAAACRTYNILAADDRRVAAGLILW